MCTWAKFWARLLLTYLFAVRCNNPYTYTLEFYWIGPGESVLSSDNLLSDCSLLILFTLLTSVLVKGMRVSNVMCSVISVGEHQITPQFMVVNTLCSA